MIQKRYDQKNRRKWLALVKGSAASFRPSSIVLYRSVIIRSTHKRFSQHSVSLHFIMAVD